MTEQIATFPPGPYKPPYDGLAARMAAVGVASDAHPRLTDALAQLDQTAVILTALHQRQVPGFEHPNIKANISDIIARLQATLQPLV